MGPRSPCGRPAPNGTDGRTDGTMLLLWLRLRLLLRSLQLPRSAHSARSHAYRRRRWRHGCWLDVSGGRMLCCSWRCCCSGWSGWRMRRWLSEMRRRDAAVFLVACRWVVGVAVADKLPPQWVSRSPLPSSLLPSSHPVYTDRIVTLVSPWHNCSAPISHQKWVPRK